MKIKMLASFAGPDMALEAGQVVDHDAAEAVRFIEAGFAVPVSEPTIERAVKAAPVETRMKGAK